MTITLRQIRQVVTPGLQDYVNSGSVDGGRANIIIPSQPLIAFDYYNGTVNVAFMQGDQLTNPFGTGADMNLLSNPWGSFAVIGLANALGGGGVCGGYGGCYTNGSSACGPWWWIADLNARTLTANCKLIPNAMNINHMSGVVLDLVNQNVIIYIEGADDSQNNFVIVPFVGLGNFLNGNTTSVKYASYINPSGVRNYKAPVGIFAGNVVLCLNGTLWYLPLSTLYSDASPTPPSSPFNKGTVKGLGSSGSSGLTNIFQSGTEYLAVIVGNSGQNVTLTVYVLDSTFNITKTISVQGINNTIHDPYPSYNGLFLLYAAINNVVYLYLVDPKSGQTDSLTIQGAWVAGDSGYLLVASQPIGSSSVTWTVYQILEDITPAFQNVSITISGNQVTAKGQLVNLNGNTPISSATVYLVIPQGYFDNFTSDVQQVLGRGTTDSNGNFTIIAPLPAGTNPTYLAVIYSPS